MFRRGRGIGRAAGAAALLLAGLAGCLPRLNRSAEPPEAAPPYVTSVRIDPRTLRPIEAEAPAEETPRGHEDTPSPE